MQLASNLSIILFYLDVIQFQVVTLCHTMILCLLSFRIQTTHCWHVGYNSLFHNRYSHSAHKTNTQTDIIKAQSRL